MAKAPFGAPLLRFTGSQGYRYFHKLAPGRGRVAGKTTRWQVRTSPEPAIALLTVRVYELFGVGEQKHPGLWSAARKRPSRRRKP